MAFDSREFRNALGNFATGVTIVTARSRTGEPLGLTANSFNSVSLDPPLVLFSLDRKATHYADFMAASYFGVNILAEEQQALSRVFSTQGIDRWEGLTYEKWETGSPILPGTLASFDCVTEARHEGGDHVILVGRVLKLGFAAEGTPLLYYRGKYDQLSKAAQVSQ